VVGGFWARMGHEVTLLGRPWHLDTVKKQGLTITGIWGDYRIKALDVCTDIESLRASGEVFDLIILTVKSPDTTAAVRELATLMGENTMLLSLQNGLGNIETVLEHVKPEQFLVGRVIFGVELEPGVARVTVTADDIVIGPAPGAKPRVTAEQIAHTFALARIPTRPVADVLPFIWSKVIYNCALNGICTLREMPYGQILENAETKNEMAQVVRECYAVAAKMNLALDPPDAEAYLELLVGSLIPKTASHFPSMLQDLRKGKRTDIEALNGAILRLGRGAGVPTPANERITQQVLKKFDSFTYK